MSRAGQLGLSLPAGGHTGTATRGRHQDRDEWIQQREWPGRGLHDEGGRISETVIRLVQLKGRGEGGYRPPGHIGHWHIRTWHPVSELLW